MAVNERKHKLIWGAFLLYVLVMVRLLFGRHTYDMFGSYWDTLKSNTNLIPFYTIKNYLWLLKHTASEYLLQHAYVNLLGNVFLFVPLGIFLPLLFSKLRAFKHYFPFLCLTILLIELIQLFTLRGSCDVDDFILNCVGGAMGYGIMKGICAFRPSTL